MMSAAWSMALASLMFAAMGVCVKFASQTYGAGEIAMYRGAVGAVLIGALAYARGVGFTTTVPGMHLGRNVTGATSLVLWFHAISGLPLSTGMTLNYMSSVWMAVFLVGGSVVMGSKRIDGRLVTAVLVGFAGVALVLKPTIGQDQLGAGLAGLLSGMLSALAYLQIAVLTRAGEPDLRIVFYFCMATVVAGAAVALATQGFHAHTPHGLALLSAVGVLAALAQLCLTRAYAIGRPLANASLAYLGIVFSVIFGVWLFDDPLAWSSIAGMMLIVVAGVAATMLRVQKAPAKDVPTGGDS